VAANGQAAVAVYTAPPVVGDFRGEAINVLAMRHGLVTQLTRFAAPHLFPRFGLAPQLSDDSQTLEEPSASPPPKPTRT
jgi:hypothetical protein